jgi:hypothetical protein
VFANLLRSQDWDRWKELVALLSEKGFATEDRRMADLLAYRAQQSRQQQTDVSLAAIKNNLVPPIKRLHRPGATLGKNIIEELKRNRVVIADVSLLGSEDGLAITGMLMRRIFQHNVRHLTDMAGQTVRCLTILEEAQTMLGDRTLDDRDVFVRWVKEGRKYGLGCILVTQQPSSISNQIISQGDNFFVLHLLNEGDLQTLRKHNAYFSEEILEFIRSEPIPGNCYFWSAPSQPFVLPARVCNFESVCQRVSEPEAQGAGTRPDPKWLSDLVARMVKEALVANPRVWLYRVSAFHGRPEAGLIAVSREYLQHAVYTRIAADPALKAVRDSAQWLDGHLGAEIGAVLSQHKARSGYATLAGSARPVWVLRQSQIRLEKGKTVRSETVEVLASI